MGNEQSSETQSIGGLVPAVILELLRYQSDSQEDPASRDYTIENDRITIVESDCSDSFVILNIEDKNTTDTVNDKPKQNVKNKNTKRKRKGHRQKQSTKQVAKDAGPDAVTKDSGIDVTKDSGIDGTKDSGIDVTKDSGIDVTKDSGIDVSGNENIGKDVASTDQSNVVDSAVVQTVQHGESNNSKCLTKEHKESKNKLDALKRQELKASQAAMIENMTQGSPLWRRKMLTCFDMLDQTGDGFIQEDDFHEMLRRIEKRYRISGRSMSNLRRHGLSFVLIDVLWKTILAAGNGDISDYQISIDVFIRVLYAYIAEEKYKEYLRVALAHTAEHMYDILDSEQDGGIDVEKYRHFLEILGAQEDVIENGFKSVDVDGTGEISKFEFIDAFTDFWMNQELGCGTLLLGKY